MRCRPPWEAYYVNNFNLFGRVWQVNIQGEAADRTDISSIWQIYIRNKYGNDVPIARDRQCPHRTRAAGHHPLQQLPRDPDTGQPGSRHVERHALAAMADVSARVLPAGYSYEWTGTAYQEVAASGQTGLILALAVLFAFLFLVGAVRELDDPGAGAAVGAGGGSLVHLSAF